MKVIQSAQNLQGFTGLLKVSVALTMALAIDPALGQMMEGEIQDPMSSESPQDNNGENTQTTPDSASSTPEDSQPKNRQPTSTPPIGSLLTSQGTGNSDDMIIKNHLNALSKKLDAATCTSSDGTSCKNCPDPLAFIFCVKDGSEREQQVKDSENLVWKTKKAEGMIRQATTTLATKPFDRELAKTAASLHFEAISANGFQGELANLSNGFKATLLKGLYVIRVKGRLPQPSGPSATGGSNAGVGTNSDQ